MGGNKGEFQDLTNRLLDRAAACGMDVSKEKCMNNISVDISMSGEKFRGGDQFQVPGSDPALGWHLLSSSTNQDCLSNGKTKQDLVVQHHQFHKQV